MRLHIAIAAMALAAAGPAWGQPRIVALSEADEAAYRAAFAEAERGDLAGVRARLRHVEDDVLVGVALGAAHLSASRRTYSQAVAWLDHYGDLAIAQDVYARAQDVRPRRARRPAAPEPLRRRPFPGTAPPPPSDSAAARADIAAIQEGLSAGAYDAARARAAGALSGPRTGEAAWLLGLMNVRAGDYAAAAAQFEAGAAWPHHPASARAANFYWAARARLAAGDARRVIPHLEAAAQAPQTFYGQLAEAQLGRASALNFTTPPLEPGALRAFLERRPAARRAAALAQLGRLSDVEEELRRLHGQLTPQEDPIFLALAEALAAPAAQLRAGEYGGPRLAAGLCPVTTFAPEGGFTLDRALLYGIVRQESYFNPVARSSSNARGLMQLLPSTANDLDRDRGYRRNPAQLYDPAENMRLGQRYVQWLIDQFHRDGDLGRVFAAYNGGPGWLQRWIQERGEIADPLYLLETLPRAESRDYAERVLSHMSICRRRFGQPTPELDALASGRPARYQALDNRSNALSAAQP